MKEWSRLIEILLTDYVILLILLRLLIKNPNNERVVDSKIIFDRISLSEYYAWFYKYNLVLICIGQVRQNDTNP